MMTEMARDGRLDYMIADAEYGEGCRDCFAGEPHMCPRATAEEEADTDVE